MARRIRKKANLTSVVEPQLVTLTKSPANRSGFKVLRSAATDEVPVEEQQEVISRADEYLIAIELKADTTEEEANQIAASYGLDDDYKVTKKNDHFYLVRDDAELEVPTISILLSGGMTAHVAQAAFQRSEENDEKAETGDEKVTDNLKGICLTAIRFDAIDFKTPFEVDSWLEKNSVAYPANGVEQTGEAYTVNRFLPSGDVREVTIAKGVTGIICRAETSDVPQAMYGMTMEQAYGDWGWGQIDFIAMLADVEFSERSSDAIEALHNVLRRIVFGSQLDLSVRKQLIVDALNGYAAYMLSLMDALPQSVIEQRSDEQMTGQENDMSKENQTVAESEGVDTKVERSEQEAAAAPAETAVEAEASTEEQADANGFVTRAELADIVTQAVSAALAATPGTEVQAERSEEAPAEAPAEEQTDMQKLIGVVGQMATALKGMQDEQQSLRKDFEEAEAGTSIVRSSVESEGEAEVESKRDDGSDESIFGGMFRGTAG